MADPDGGVIEVLREPCQCCGLPMPLADLMFCALIKTLALQDPRQAEVVYESMMAVLGEP